MSSAHRYLDVLERVAQAHANAKSAKAAKSALRRRAQNSQNLQYSHAQAPASKRRNEKNPYGSTIATLEARCPDLVPVDRWQQAVADGKTFLSRWGDQAHALGWTTKDLFGLLTVPGHAKPSSNRLSRFDETGLVWLVDGRRVVALTEGTAAIENPTSGAVTMYRRHNKPALGPLGDSLEDFTGGLR